MYQQLYEHLEPQLHQNQFGARKRDRARKRPDNECHVGVLSHTEPGQNVFLSLLDITNAFSRSDSFD
jgi:hypothetical protein